MPSTQKPTKVLYIAGAGRSGGTLLGQILGQHHELLYAGELLNVWTPGLLVDRLCGCNTKLIECPFWITAFDYAYGSLENIDSACMSDKRLQLTRTRHIPLAAFQRLVHYRTTETARYLDNTVQLYQSLIKTTGRSILVDASRSNAYARLLESTPEIHLYILHLIRDPRAVAFSWLRKRTGTTATRVVELRRIGPAHAAVDWVAQNIATASAWENQPRYLRVRYEDFIDQPHAHLLRIMDWLGMPVAPLNFVSEGKVKLDVCHSAAGNAYRLKTGWVPLQLDDEWKQAMNPRHRAIVNLITLPWCKKYGYPVRVT